jgi:hypothetical protein
MDSLRITLASERAFISVYMCFSEDASILTNIVRKSEVVSTMVSNMLTAFRLEPRVKAISCRAAYSR